MASKVSGVLPALSQRTIQIAHVMIPCNRSFEDAKAALEHAVPPLDPTFQTLLKSGDHKAALEALQGLPPLNNFTVPPRDFGRLLNVLDKKVKAVQYEIGNPLTATSMTRFELGIGLYAPVRVLLREDQDGKALFEFDRPSSMMGQFGDKGVDEVAGALDEALMQVLVTAAGWEGRGQ